MVLQFITRREMTGNIQNGRRYVLLPSADLQFTNGNTQNSYMFYIVLHGHFWIVSLSQFLEIYGLIVSKALLHMTVADPEKPQCNCFSAHDSVPWEFFSVIGLDT